MGPSGRRTKVLHQTINSFRTVRRLLWDSLINTYHGENMSKETEILRLLTEIRDLVQVLVAHQVAPNLVEQSGSTRNSGTWARWGHRTHTRHDAEPERRVDDREQ